MVQVARRSASVLKRRKSRNRMEVPVDRSHEGPSPSAGSINEVSNAAATTDTPKDGESEVIYYIDEPHAPGNQSKYTNFSCPLVAALSRENHDYSEKPWQSNFNFV